MRALFLLSSLFLLFLFACQKDKDIDPISGEAALHYDGDNQSAPAIGRGITYAAIKFSEDEIVQTNSLGKILADVDFYVQDLPQSLRILIFGWNTDDESQPGNVFYESTIGRNDINSNQWNRHKLGQEIPIPQDGFWIAVEVNAGDSDLRVVGCDQGPRHTDGDVYGVFGDNLPGWSSLYDFSNQSVNVNWNIRGRTK